MHWAQKNRRHQEWKTRAIVGERGLRGRHRPMQRARVSGCVIYIGSVLMDDDNAVARLKWCFDLLVERGLLVDDKRPHLTLAVIPEQRQGSPRRVVLTLEEVA